MISLILNMNIKSIKQKAYSLLRKSEKWTKTDMVYLTKGGSILTFAKVFSSITSFVLSIAFANLLLKDTYGTYQYVISILGILLIPSLGGMSDALTRAVAKGHEGSIKKSLFTKIKWGTIGSVMSLVVSLYYLYNNNNLLGLIFLIIAPLIPFVECFAVAGSILSGRKLFKQSTLLFILFKAINVFSIIAALFLTKNLIIIVLVYLISIIIARIFNYFYILKKFKPNNKEDPTTINYGKHLSLMDVVGTIIDNLDRIILWHYIGAAGVAVYSLSKAPINQVRSALNPISNLALPKFSGQDNRVLKKTLPNKIFKLSLLLVPIVIIYIILAPFLYKLFYPNYLESVKYSILYAFTLLIYPFRFFGTSILAQGDKKSLYKLKIIPPLTRVILYFILIPTFKIYGAIYAFLITSFLSNLMAFYFFKYGKKSI